MTSVMFEIQMWRSLYKPCFGFFLQGGVKALAMMDIGIQFTMMITFMAGIIYAEVKDIYVYEKESEPKKHEVRKYLYWTFYFFYEVVSIVLALFLLDWCNKRSREKIGNYLITSIFLYPLWLGFFLSHCIWLDGLPAMVIAPFAGFSLFKLYSFWVVYAFLKEISYYGGFNAALRRFTDAEIEEFENGNPTCVVTSEDDVGADFKNRPYKKEFEIERERLQIDESSPLGKGAFATVLKAYLKFNRTNYCNYGTTVAVKTLSPNADLMYFKALLSELKILSYISGERHDHIVNLIGACTSQIRERKIFIIVEFCPYGNVMNYLRANRGLFANLVKDDIINTSSLNSSMENVNSPYLSHMPDAPNTLDLVKWAMQTASGMEYISRKKVIHGDLSARNILLTEDKNVKIADFGLSRQLYQYSTYVKNGNDPLPWRWLAPESIHDLKFSTQSDVWSYGICLWEFFTCSETPYPGYSYNGDFINELRNHNLRPRHPQFATSEIYEIMKQCWHSDPTQRPSFKELENVFKQIFDKGNLQIAIGQNRNSISRKFNTLESVSSGIGTDISEGLTDYISESS